MKNKIIIMVGVCLLVGVIALGIWSLESQRSENSRPWDVSSKKDLAFLDDFTRYGYTAEQIEEMRTILVNVGVTELTNVKKGNVSYGMQTVTGYAYKSDWDEVQIRFNIENGVLYYVNVYCPDNFTYLSGLDDGRAELYYDKEGGYLKKIDWENKTVVNY